MRSSSGRLPPAGTESGFRPAPPTRTVKLSPYVIVLYTSVALPAGDYRWRACFHAPGDLAVADPERPSGCTGFGFHGAGRLPVGFPGPVAITRAGRYLNTRGAATQPWPWWTARAGSPGS